MSQPQAPMTGHTPSPPVSESPLRACVVIPVYDHPATVSGRPETLRQSRLHPAQPARP